MSGNCAVAYSGGFKPSEPRNWFICAVASDCCVACKRPSPSASGSKFASAYFLTRSTRRCFRDTAGLKRRGCWFMALILRRKRGLREVEICIGAMKVFVGVTCSSFFCKVFGARRLEYGHKRRERDTERPLVTLSPRRQRLRLTAAPDKLVNLLRVGSGHRSSPKPCLLWARTGHRPSHQDKRPAARRCSNALTFV
jgi:hypothetical protein